MMWFDIVKLDLSQIEVQGDVEGRNINIPKKNKCQEKIRRFTKNLYSEFALDDWVNDHIENINENQGVSEKVFCWIVERLDKFFDAPFGKINAGKIETKTKIGHFQDNGARYTLLIRSSLYVGSKVRVPFYLNLIGPKEIAPYNDGERTMYFLQPHSKEKSKETYEKIKSCWERA